MRLSMSTNAPDSGRSDQRVSAVTWNSTIRPLPRALRGDQRRAVGERRPGAVGERGVGLGQHLAGDRDVGRHRHAEERALAREGGELLRLVPAQAPPRTRPPRRSLHRHEVVVGGGEPRTGEAHQHAAVLDPARRAARAPRATLPTSARISIGRRCSMNWLTACAGEPRSASRTSANGSSARDEIEGRGEQRLRGVGGRAGDHADRASAPALVEQLHRAGRALAGDLEAGDVVADLDRQRRARLRSRARRP